jgi:hypothetical protein
MRWGFFGFVLPLLLVALASEAANAARLMAPPATNPAPGCTPNPDMGFDVVIPHYLNGVHPPIPPPARIRPSRTDLDIIVAEDGSFTAINIVKPGADPNYDAFLVQFVKQHYRWDPPYVAQNCQLTVAHVGIDFVADAP